MSNNWKQRFFVPIEEEQGIAILAVLLEQFPVIATEDEEADSDVPHDLAMPSASTVQPIDVETWIIETAEPKRVKDEELQRAAMSESESDPTSKDSEATCPHPSQSASLPSAAQRCEACLLQTPLPNYRTPAIQIGFNFAEKRVLNRTRFRACANAAREHRRHTADLPPTLFASPGIMLISV